MGTVHLSIELAFDFIAFAMGCVLIGQAKDNYLKLYWGIIAASIGLFFVWENIGWLMIVTDTPEYRFTSLLSIDKMLKWYALASVVSLFPMASLYPGYFNHLRLLIFLLPPVFQRTPHSALFLKRNWGTHRRNRHPATCMHLPDIHPVAPCFFYFPACFPTSLQTHQPEHVFLYRIHVPIFRHLHHFHFKHQ